MLPRILLLSDIFPPKTGGSGRWFWEIYTRLPSERLIVASGEDPRGADFDRTHFLAVQRFPLTMATRGLRPVGNVIHYLSLARRIRKLIRQHSIDVVHAGRNLPEGFLAYLVRRMSGTPYLCYAHGEDIGVSATSRELAWMTRQVLAGARGMIANSLNTRRMLLEDWRVPEQRVYLLHPGVDCGRFVPAERDEARRRELGWSGRKILLTVGRLQKRKGHDMLIRALPAIRERHPQVLYSILGDGEERAVLADLAERLGVSSNVQFLGEVSDAELTNCYQQCDLFLLPNRAIGRDVEGFGMVLLEAQACGRPVVAGASGGTAETMDIPHTGLVIPCEEPEPLAGTIADLLADPARLDRMGQAGREWVQRGFDWSALAERARQLFETGR